MYTLKIIWGEAPEQATTPEVYEFNTYAELEAFLWGVEEMDGWLGCQIVEKSDDE
jgi:hypothetical protein